MPHTSLLVSGSSHPAFALAMAKEWGVDLMKVEIKRFASNEIYVRLLESARGKEAFVVQTSTQNVNEDYMELFLLCNTLKRSFASKIHVIIPYFGYSRQDRVALPRETISAKLIADLLVSSGADHLITVDLHSAQIQGFFDIPVDNIDPSKIFLKYIQANYDLNDTVMVSVDAGGAKAVKRFADLLGLPIAVINKQRKAHNQSEVTHIVGDVQGKHCIIYDDMVDTAGSVCNAKEALLKAGAMEDIALAITHPVLSGNAVERLNESTFSQILVTDSIPLPKNPPKNIKVLSLVPLMTEIVRRIELNEPVSDLY